MLDPQVPARYRSPHRRRGDVRRGTRGRKLGEGRRVNGPVDNDERGLEGGVARRGRPRCRQLDQIAQVAKKGKSNCLVVVRDGKLAGEWYFRGTGPNTTQDVFSVTKSVTSTLVGIAQDDGDLEIADNASTWIPQWRGTPADAVTVRDLLSNDSGREWSLASTTCSFSARRDRTAFAVGLRPSAAARDGVGVQQLRGPDAPAGVQSATGQDVAAFARQRLFGPLGMTHTDDDHRPAGNAQMFEGVQSTCRDMARFGVLMLNHGKWGGSRSCRPPGSRRRPGTRRRSSTRRTATCGGSTARASSPSPLAATD